MAFRRKLLLTFCACACLNSLPALTQATLPLLQTKSSPVIRKKSAAPTATPGSPGLSFAPAVPYGSGGNGGNSVVVADLNGDGIPDLVVADWCTSICPNGNVGVLLGNGNGTFQAAASYASGGQYADAIAVKDVNGDGKLDLIVGNCGSVQGNICVGGMGGVGVLLGKGDGTFNAATAYSPTYGVSAVEAADVNGDGKIDLVIATNCTSGTSYTGCVGVLSGNGDGTFASAVTYLSGAYSPGAIAVADLNGDGKPDVVVAHCGISNCSTGTGNIGVLLNNGDGTFSAGVVYGANGVFSDGIAIADVNGDGKPDVVVANSSTSTTVNAGDVAVLLGNGDGSFQGAVAYPSGGYGTASVAVADVNGDGKLDLVVANCSESTGACTDNVSGSVGVGVLLGNGDGTFQTVVNYASGGTTPFGVAVADLNGDSKPDIVTANCAGASCGLAGLGTVGVLLNTSLGGTTTVLTSSANPTDFGAAVTFTATVTSSFKGPLTGTVNFLNGTTNIGTSTLNSSGVATLSTSTLAAGSASITASYSGDANFVPSTSNVLTLNVQNFTLSASPKTVTISSPGQTGSTTITVSTSGNLDPGSVSNFSCSGLPALTACSFAAGSAKDTASLTIQTAGAAELHWPASGHHQELFYAMLLPGLLGVVTLAGHKRKLRVLALLAVLSLAAVWSACGGNSSSSKSGGTPTGTSTVTVSATSGTLKGSTTFTLVVQ